MFKLVSPWLGEYIGHKTFRFLAVRNSNTDIFKMGSATMIVLIIYFSLSYGQHTSYHQDFMSQEDKTVVKKLIHDLIRRIHLHNRQLLDIKQQHNGRISYQIGLVIGTIREKYKRCMDIYRELNDRITGKVTIFGPGVWRFKPLHYAIGMETIRRLEVEIDKYIHVILSIPERDLQEDSRIHMNAQGPQLPNSGGEAAIIKPPTNLRTLKSVEPNASSTVTKETPNEEDIKRRYREEYMKQSGLKGNDWSLDHYYGFA